MEEELLQIIKDWIDLSKDWIKEGEFNPFKTRLGKEYPEPYAGYNDALRQFLRISIHTTRDTFPREAFERLLPNMDKEGIDWLEENYEPITQSVPRDFQNTVYRAFNGVQLDYNGVDEDVTDYLDREVPTYGSIDKYMKHIQIKLMLDDAMGVLAVMPERVEYEEVDEETARITGDIDPKPMYFECWRVIHYEQNRSVIVLSSERSVVQYGGHSKRNGLIFYAFDRDFIYRYEQVGKQIDWEFAVTMAFPHEIGVVPAIRMGGVPKLDDNKLNYDSYLKGAIAPLNLALHDNVMLNAVKRKCAFPTPVMVADECNYVDPRLQATCDNGLLKYTGEDGEWHEDTCPNCKGTGRGQNLNVFTTMFAPPRSRESEHKYTANDVLTYVSPPPETMIFLRDEVKYQLNEARSELKITRAVGETGHVTATEKGIDLKATYAFIKPIADMLISRYQYAVDIMVAMKFGDSENAPKVLPVRNFDLKTSEDYIEEIKMAQEAGLPSVLVQNIVSKYLYSEYEGSYVSERIVDTIIAADRLYHLSTTQAATIGDNAERWEVILNNSSWSLIMTLIDRDEAWIEKDIDVRVAELQAAAKALVTTASNPALDALELGG